MNERDVLITGTPRSGTTLVCHLLNRLPDVVALHEPMKVRTFARLSRPDEVCAEVATFCAEQLLSIHQRKRAISKQAEGVVRDNPIGAERSGTGLRQQIDAKGEVVIEKELAQDFMLAVKHTSAFAGVLGQIASCFPVYAIVRNPLATLASWGTVDIAIQSGRSPNAERLDPELEARLAAIDNGLDRQIHLLSWFYEQFRRYLPERAIIHYETIVSTGGRAVSVVHPGAAGLAEPLSSRNTNSLYDHRHMLRIGERLLGTDGAFWEFHPRQSVEDLLTEVASGAG